jgi:hypothetical protein
VDFLARLLPRIIAGIASILDASNLRDRVYMQQQEHELMWTSLDDIARMYKDTPVGEFAKETLSRVNAHYGR